MNEGEVYFGLIGDGFEPDAITKFLGIDPTRAKAKGEPRPKKSFWIISSGNVEAEIVDIYKLSSTLIEKIKPLKDKINLAKKQFNLESYLEVVLRISTDESISTPSVGFDSDVIEFLHEVGASIDIDIYRN